MSTDAIVPYASITPFARGDGVETRLMVGRERVDTPPFTTGTTVFLPEFNPPNGIDETFGVKHKVSKR